MACWLTDVAGKQVCCAHISRLQTAPSLGAWAQMGSGVTLKGLVPTLRSPLCHRHDALKASSCVSWDLFPCPCTGTAAPVINPVAVRELHLGPGQHLEQVFTKRLLTGFHSWSGDPWLQVYSCSLSLRSLTSVVLRFGVQAESVRMPRAPVVFENGQSLFVLCLACTDSLTFVPKPR